LEKRFEQEQRREPLRVDLQATEDLLRLTAICRQQIAALKRWVDGLDRREGHAVASAAIDRLWLQMQEAERLLIELHLVPVEPALLRVGAEEFAMPVAAVIAVGRSAELVDEGLRTIDGATLLGLAGRQGARSGGRSLGVHHQKGLRSGEIIANHCRVHGSGVVQSMRM